jgi:hypothetical protein
MSIFHKIYPIFRQINVVTQLVIMLSFAFAMNMLGIRSLLVSLVIFAFVLSSIEQHHFYRMLSRVKWVCLIILMVYGLNTPGQHLNGWPEAWSPTYEGLQAGVTQLLRIVCVLALLAYVLTVNTRSQLISGFYFLLSPLGLLGIDIKRFAVRLWLTLHYVEMGPKLPFDKGFLTHFDQHLSDIFKQAPNELIEIVLEKPMFTAMDYGCMGLSLIALMFVLLGVVT